jgi:hypothetical protein
LGVALLVLHVDARTECLTEYDGRVVVIGIDFTQSATVDPFERVCDLLDASRAQG